MALFRSFIAFPLKKRGEMRFSFHPRRNPFFLERRTFKGSLSLPMRNAFISFLPRRMLSQVPEVSQGPELMESLDYSNQPSQKTQKPLDSSQESISRRRVRFFNIQLTQLRQQEKWDKLDELWKRMKSKGLIDTISVNIMIDRWGAAGDLTRVKGAIKLLEQHGLKPNSYTFNLILKWLGEHKQWDEMKRYHAEMVQHFVEPDQVTFNSMLAALGKSDQVEDALKLYSDAQNKGTPDILTHNMLLYTLCKSGHINDMVEIFKMVKGMITPNEMTYNILLKGLGTEGRLNEMLVYFHELLDSGSTPSVVTYTTLINAFGRHGNKGEVLTLVQSIRSKQLILDVFTYNTLIVALSKHQQGDLISELLDEMKERQIPFNDVSFNVIIHAFGRVNRTDLMLKWLEEMKHLNFTPNVMTYSSIIDALGKRKLIALMLQCLRDMKEYNLQPNAFTYSSVFHAFGKSKCKNEALALYNELKADNFSFNHVLYCSIFNCFNYCKDLDTLHAIYLEAKERGLLSPAGFSVLFQAYGNQYRAQELDMLMSDMLALDMQLSNSLYSSIIASHVRCNKLKVSREYLLRKSFCWKAKDASVFLEGLTQFNVPAHLTEQWLTLRSSIRKEAAHNLLSNSQGTQFESFLNGLEF